MSFGRVDLVDDNGFVCKSIDLSRIEKSLSSLLADRRTVERAIGESRYKSAVAEAEHLKKQMLRLRLIEVPVLCLIVIQSFWLSRSAAVLVAVLIPVLIFYRIFRVRSYPQLGWPEAGHVFLSCRICLACGYPGGHPDGHPGGHPALAEGGTECHEWTCSECGTQWELGGREQDTLRPKRVGRVLREPILKNEIR